MLELTGLIAISALGFASYFAIFYVTNMINTMGDQVVTGFVGDHPIPGTDRWLLLYSRWLSYVIGVLVAALFPAFAAVVIADHVGGDNIRRLGYVAAFLMVLAAANLSMQNLIHFIRYRAILRQAEAD